MIKSFVQAILRVFNISEGDCTPKGEKPSEKLLQTFVKV